jgi:hypothetical protein
MKFSEFLAEIKTQLRKYDNEGLIDELSVKMFLYDELKRFGNNIMVDYRTVIDVKDGKYTLPINFWKLNFAYICEPAGYKVDKESKKHLQKSFFWKEVIEERREWDECDDGCDDWDERVITENIYFNDVEVKFNYRIIEPLRIRRNINSSKCTNGCINFASNSENELTITGRTLYFNFSEGKVYISYKGLLIDEDGEVEIPETQHSRLKDYLFNFVKWKILEDIAINDDINVYNLSMNFKNEAKSSFIDALKETKREGLNQDSLLRLKNRNRLTTMAHESLFK